MRARGEDAWTSFRAALDEPSAFTDVDAACNAIGGTRWSRRDDRGGRLRRTCARFLPSIDEPGSAEVEYFRAAKYLITVLFFQAECDRARVIAERIGSKHILEKRAAGVSDDDVRARCLATDVARTLLARGMSAPVTEVPIHRRRKRSHRARRLAPQPAKGLHYYQQDRSVSPSSPRASAL